MRLAGRALRIFIGVVLAGLGLSIFLIRPESSQASGPGEAAGRMIGLASNPLTCLATGAGAAAEAAGTIHLTWPGQAQSARLVLSVVGAEAEHTIQVNGQPVATTPVYPEGGLCEVGQAVVVEIPPGLLIKGDNRIEISDDALDGDRWSAAYVRLEVFGDFQADAVTGRIVGVGQVASSTTVISFVNPYDSTAQEALVLVSGGYNSGTPTPLVIALHGRSSTMEEGIDTYGAAVDGRNWLLASPQFHGSWPGTVAFPQPDPPGVYAYASLESQYDIIGTINYMLANYNIDLDRIYLAGSSMGGQIGVITGAKFPHLFAAVLDNKGPTDMAQWRSENTNFHQDWMERECHLNEVSQTPAQNPFCYQRRSGLNFASNYLHLPISMTHSLGDTLVPITHSYRLRDAINSYNPDYPVTLYVDTAVGPTCSNPNQHCFNPDPEAVLNFFDPFRLNQTPADLQISSDESKPYYWLNIAQVGGDHWSQVEATFDQTAGTVTAVLSDTQAPLSVGFNLGSTATTDVIPVPGLGLPNGTYQVVEQTSTTVITRVVNYPSGSTYLTSTMTATGQLTVTISPLSIVWPIYLPVLIAGDPP